MKPQPAHSYEKWLMLIGIPLFMIVQWFANKYYEEPLSMNLWQRNALTLLVVLLQWFVVQRLVHRFRKRFPLYRQIIWRVGFSIVVGGIVGMFVAFLVNLIPDIIGGKWSASLLGLASNFGPMFFFSALIVSAYEVSGNFYELARLENEKQALKKAHVQSQYDSLKSQVNPHFLFNSLNTLLSLIAISPQKAEEFVEELASVYRYLLQTNAKETTTLQEEMAFAGSYFHLLKTRYALAIELKVQTDETLLCYHLPSLTLQLLMENAVKHNVISADQPLRIEIFTSYALSDQPQITVRNNLQLRTMPVASNQLGLSNIISKFKLLRQPDLAITDSGGFFTVTMPLFKP